MDSMATTDTEEEVMLLKPAPEGATAGSPWTRKAVHPDDPLPHPFFRAYKAVVEGKNKKVMVCFGSGEDKRYVVPLAVKRRAKCAPKLSRYVKGNNVKRRLTPSLPQVLEGRGGSGQGSPSPVLEGGRDSADGGDQDNASVSDHPEEKPPSISRTRDWNATRSLVRRVNKLEKQVEAAYSRIDELKTTTEQAKAQSAQLKLANGEKLRAHTENLKQQKRKAEEQITRREQMTKQACNMQTGKLKKEIKTKETKINRLRAQNGALQEKVKEAKEREKAAAEERERAERRASNYLAEKERAERKMEKSVVREKEARASTLEQVKKNETLQKKNDELRAEFDGMMDDMDVIVREHQKETGGKKMHLNELFEKVCIVVILILFPIILICLL